jgi:hypothetical protein
VSCGTVIVCVTHGLKVRESVEFCGRPVSYRLERWTKRHTGPSVEKHNIRM